MAGRRDATIRDLRGALRQRLAEDAPCIDDKTAALRDLIGDLEKHLGTEIRRRTSLEMRLTEMRDELSRESSAGQSLQSDAATSRADIVLFPIDCVSHEAVLMVKRLCRQTDKRFIPLRSAGATSLHAALRSLAVATANRTA